jgi:hypothetical protein
MHKSIQRTIGDNRGVTMMATMIIMLMIAVLGVAALTMSGIGNSTIGALRMAEEGAAAAESCIGVGVDIIQRTIVPNGSSQVPLALQMPQGPVPAANAAALSNEILRNPANSPDCPIVTTICGVANPNLTMVVNNYQVNGDIDSLFARPKPGSQGATDLYFRIDCAATNVATGTTTRVIAIYDCVTGGPSGLGVCFPHNI